MRFDPLFGFADVGAPLGDGAAGVAGGAAQSGENKQFCCLSLAIDKLAL